MAKFPMKIVNKLPCCPFCCEIMKNDFDIICSCRMFRFAHIKDDAINTTSEDREQE